MLPVSNKCKCCVGAIYFHEKELMMIWGKVYFKSTSLKRLIEWHYFVKKNKRGKQQRVISHPLLLNCAIIVLHLVSHLSSCGCWRRLDDLAIFFCKKQTANRRGYRRGKTAHERTNHTTERGIKHTHSPLKADSPARFGSDCFCLLFIWLFDWLVYWFHSKVEV